MLKTENIAVRLRGIAVKIMGYSTKLKIAYIQKNRGLRAAWLDVLLRIVFFF